MKNENLTKEELLSKISKLETENSKIKELYQREINELKKIEEALRESELKYRSLIENSSDVVFCVNEKGEYKFTNQVFANTLGHSPEYFVGKTFWDVYPKEHADHRQNASKKVFETGEVQSVEVVVPLPDRTLYYLAKANPIRDDNGKVILNLTTAVDITDRKLAEEQIQNQNKELAELNASKDKFFSIIAHDLKAPFSSFLGLTKILSDETQNLSMDELQDFSKSMQKLAMNLYKLLENLLEWARIQRGQTKFNPEACLLYMLINQNVEIQSEVAKQKQINIQNNVSDGLIVNVDVPMFNTVIRNLISNALKFTPQGGNIKIGIADSEAMSNNSADKYDKETDLVLYVKDSGIGMSKKMIDDLFQIDKKVSRPGTNGELSTGLGLFLCKEFIDKHQGNIWVESEEGFGSTFYISIKK